ncbi:MAG: thioether cross-link-forming SCIFF peptide maturase [Oscillospiraceae bacterium]
MIHRFERANMYLALDTGSGAVHVLDKPAYALLGIVTLKELAQKELAAANEQALQQLYAEFGKQQVNTTFEELCALFQEGLLYSDDSYSEFKEKLGDSPIKAMCLHMAHDCNLRCKYCFASTGDFGGGRKLMPLETAKKSIDLLISLSKGRRNLEVDFFGGEPMMNYAVLCQTVEYARAIEKQEGKNFRFTVTTNGLSLNDRNIEMINREMSNVVLSLDGRQSVNDKMRLKIDGSGSYDTIVPKFQKLVQGRGDKEYYVRGTYTRDNLDFDKDVLELYNLGFDQISVEPVVGPETDDYSIRPQDIAAIEQSYTRLMQEMAKRKRSRAGDFNFFHFMIDLDNGPCAIKRLKGCGSGNEYIAITPDGEIYPCHQFVGKPEFIMGSVDAGITKPELKKTFADANLFSKPTCMECWAKFFCSGGCNANNYAFNGSILEPHKLSCELEKIRLECAIAMQALLAQ